MHNIHAWEKPLYRRAIGLGKVAADPESNTTLLGHGDCFDRFSICFDGVELGLQSGFDFFPA